MKFCENCGYEFKENEKYEDKYIYKIPIKYCGNIIEKILIIFHIKKRPFIACDSLEKYFQIMEIYERK